MLPCSVYNGPSWIIAQDINSLAFGDNYLKSVSFSFIFLVEFMSAYCEIAVLYMPKKPVDYKAALVPLMALLRQATSHYQNQYWPRPRYHIASLGHSVQDDL